MDLSRRELLAAATAAGAALAFEQTHAQSRAATPPRVVAEIDFTAPPAGRRWGPTWRSVAVANLLRAEGEGLLEAGSDVFPNDPRPVAFAVDRRVRDAEITATLGRVGSAPGVVLRRTSPRSYYAAIYDTGRGTLRLMRRSGADLVELAFAPVPSAESPITLVLEASGSRPTALRAVLTDSRGASFTAVADDRTAELQRAGDPGVLATAETLFPSDSNPVLPALGNLHLLPWGVQEGQAFMASDPGQEVVKEIRRRSTAGFSTIAVRSAERARPSAASVVAATTGPPVPGGAELHVASDLPATVAVDVSYSPRFRDFRRVSVGKTGRHHAATTTVRGLTPGRRAYWRARLRREGRLTVGPTRSFRVPPRAAANQSARVAVAACGAQFGPIFGHLADARPDVFVWQGDLNYPDTHGPLAQTTSAYAGIWRDFLANPLLEPILRDTAFAPQRDDHDYGVQDANSTNVHDFPWGLEPWTALMSRRSYYRFPVGAGEVWVLDQRLHKSDPNSPDDRKKTLLGARQRRWLMDTLARSPAQFKVVCSPCTLFMRANGRDGNWSNGFEAERKLLLDHIDRRVEGRTIFLTGDTHLTGVFDSDGRFEARAAPVGIPAPNDITLLDPFAADNLRAEPGVTYAGDECHFTLLDVRGRGRGATLDLRLVREDGEIPYERRFTPSRAARTRAR